MLYPRPCRVNKNQSTINLVILSRHKLWAANGPGKARRLQRDGRCLTVYAKTSNYQILPMGIITIRCHGPWPFRLAELKDWPLGFSEPQWMAMDGIWSREWRLDQPRIWIANGSWHKTSKSKRFQALHWHMNSREGDPGCLWDRQII
jgi:hypothetical protein